MHKRDNQPWLRLARLLRMQTSVKAVHSYCLLAPAVTQRVSVNHVGLLQVNFGLMSPVKNADKKDVKDIGKNIS